MKALVVLCVVGGAIAGGSLTSASASAQAMRTTRDGVFTIAQARRGEEIYLRECTLCHRDNLLGNSVDGGPPLRGLQFTTRWQDIDVETLVSTVEALMPLEEPGSLSRQEYIDILGYVLWANQLPAGEDELPTGPDDLQKIIVTFEP
jgi:cytochrome c